MTVDTNAPDLLPCPFCGGSASIEQRGNRRQSTIYQCDYCGCSLETGEEWGHGKDWNTRAPQEAAVRKAREVKSLAWTDYGSEMQVTSLGMGYMAYETKPYSWNVVRDKPDAERLGTGVSRADAVRLAQADYERRIREALE